MPLYDGNLEAAAGPPDNAYKLKRLIGLQHGVFIASPIQCVDHAAAQEHARLGLARARRQEPPLAAYKGRAFALGAASNGTTRHALADGAAPGARARLRRAGDPRAVAVREAASAFDEEDNLKEERTMGLLKAVVQRLVRTGAWVRMSRPAELKRATG